MAHTTTHTYTRCGHRRTPHRLLDVHVGTERPVGQVRMIVEWCPDCGAFRRTTRTRFGPTPPPGEWNSPALDRIVGGGLRTTTPDSSPRELDGDTVADLQADRLRRLEDAAVEARNLALRIAGQKVWRIPDDVRRWASDAVRTIDAAIERTDDA